MLLVEPQVNSGVAIPYRSRSHCPVHQAMAGQILLQGLFESCLNRSVLIRVVRSNLPQIERKSMALVSSYEIVFRMVGSQVREYLLRRLAICKAQIRLV